MAVTQVDICNRAMSKLGANRISSITENSPNAKKLLANYDTILEAELRRHYWRFAIKRAQLAADADAPLFGKDNSFQLPSDWLRMVPRDQNENFNDLDWEIEGRKILTDEDAPLNIRYISKVTDTSQYDALFVDALAARIALELCEEITQSNTKLAALSEMYKAAIQEARKANAFETLPQKPWEDEWVTVRL